MCECIQIAWIYPFEDYFIQNRVQRTFEFNAGKKTASKLEILVREKNSSEKMGECMRNSYRTNNNSLRSTTAGAIWMGRRIFDCVWFSGCAIINSFQQLIFTKFHILNDSHYEALCIPSHFISCEPLAHVYIHSFLV